MIITKDKWLILLLISVVLCGVQKAAAQLSENSDSAETSTLPDSSAQGSGWTNFDPTEIVENATKPEKLSSTLEIMLMMTVLSLAPSIIIMTTCFTRIVVVLALLRQAMATNQLPPTQVITALALFMTFCVMAPTWQKVQSDAITPYANPAEGEDSISLGVAWDRAKTHLRHFMAMQIENTGNSEDVYMFTEFNQPNEEVQQKIRDETLQWQDVSTVALVPAFVTSELKQAFLMGFYIYLPFLVIDMVIASVLMSMGMMMLPPALISLPFKLLLFVLVDGWHLVIGSLMSSFTNNALI